jgi:hypothetical protein
MEVSFQLLAPLALPPWKESPVPLGQEAVWVPEPVNISAAAENRTPVIHSIASHYTGREFINERPMYDVVLHVDANQHETQWNQKKKRRYEAWNRPKQYGYFLCKCYTGI